MFNNTEGFYIKKVIVNNFRGYKGKVSFNFEKDGEIPKLILLTGANGYGKTSLIDAIEWGITGKISRLIKYLDNRVDSTDKNNKKNNEGLIINTNAEQKLVEVEIYASYMGRDVFLKRKFEGELPEREVIKGNGSEFIIECNNDQIKNEVRNKLLGFNNDHLCSYDKNIDLYSKGRKDIYKIFSSLYNDKYNIGNIILNLDNTQKILANKSELINKEIEDIKAKIEDYKIERENNSKEIKNISYPKSKIYEEEIILDDISVSILSREEIKKQIKILSDLRDIELSIDVNYIESIHRKNRKFEMQVELYKALDLKEDIFVKLLNTNFNDLSNNIKELQEIKKYITKINKYEDIYSNITYRDTIISMSELDRINRVKDIEKTIENLEERVTVYSDENPTVKVLRYIVDNTLELVEYQKNHKNCPLCGNDKTFKNAQIGEIAREVLGQNDIERQNINSKIKNLVNIKNKEIEELKSNIIKVIDNKISNINYDLSERNYVDKINKLLKNLEIEYSEDLKNVLQAEITKFSVINTESEEEMISYINSKNYSFLSDNKFNLQYENYKKLNLDDKIKLLSLIKYRLKLNIDTFKNGEYKETNRHELDNRIAICNSYINILENDELLNKIELLEKNIKYKEKEVLIVNKKISDTKEMIRKIKNLKSENEKKQTELIQVPLDNIYRKITRNTNIKKIKLTKAKAEGTSDLDIVDLSGKTTSFANILSAGQLSTLAISIFLAKASLNHKNNVKIYLMDEPIQTMDDLNILSFIDLMKYQLSNGNKETFLDQVIFSTCDENLSRLFTYKFNSFQIPVCEYKFEGRSIYSKF